MLRFLRPLAGATRCSGIRTVLLGEGLNETFRDGCSPATGLVDSSNYCLDESSSKIAANSKPVQENATCYTSMAPPHCVLPDGKDSHYRPQRETTRGSRQIWTGRDVCLCPRATGIRKVTLLFLLSKVAVFTMLALQHRTAGLFPVDGFAVGLAIGSGEPGTPSTGSPLRQQFNPTKISSVPSPTLGDSVSHGRRFTSPVSTIRLHSSTDDGLARYFVRQPLKQAAMRPHNTLAQLFHSNSATAVPLLLPSSFAGLKHTQRSRGLGKVALAYHPHTLEKATAATGSAGRKLGQATKNVHVVELNFSPSGAYQLSPETLRLPSHSAEASPASSGRANVSGSMLQRSQKATFPPFEQVSFATNKGRRRELFQGRSYVQLDGLVRRDHPGRKLRVQTQSQGSELGVHPSGCKGGTQEAQYEENRPVLLQRLGQVPCLRVKSCAGRSLKQAPISHLREYRNARRELGRNTKNKEADQKRKRQVSQLQQRGWQQRQRRPVSEVDIGSSSFLGSSTKSDQDANDDGDEGDDGKDGDDGDDRPEEEEKEKEDSDGDDESESESDKEGGGDEKRKPRIVIRGPLGMAARLAGGVVKSIFG